MNIILKTTVNASNSSGNITSFYINQTFKDDILVFKVSTTSKGKNWNSAGYITQFIEIDGKLINLKSQRILLDDYLCIKSLNVNSNPYYIHFNPENWLVDLSLKVYSVDNDLSQALALNTNTTTTETDLIINNLTQVILSQALSNQNNSLPTTTQNQFTANAIKSVQNNLYNRLFYGS
jgi:hypothetical protein